jgi:hypothetical protein
LPDVNAAGERSAFLCVLDRRMAVPFLCRHTYVFFALSAFFAVQFHNAFRPHLRNLILFNPWIFTTSVSAPA